MISLQPRGTPLTNSRAGLSFGKNISRVALSSRLPHPGPLGRALLGSGCPRPWWLGAQGRMQLGGGNMGCAVPGSLGNRATREERAVPTATPSAGPPSRLPASWLPRPAHWWSSGVLLCFPTRSPTQQTPCHVPLRHVSHAGKEFTSSRHLWNGVYFLPNSVSPGSSCRWRQGPDDRDVMGPPAK